MKNHIHLIVVNRSIRGLSLRELEKLSGISHERLSRYERGIYKLSKETFDQIMNSMGVCVTEDTHSNEELQNLYNQFIEDIFWCKMDTNKYYRIIEENKYRYASCANCHLMEIIRFVCDVSIKKENKKHIRIIDKLILNDEEKKIILGYKGLYARKKNEFYKAIEYYEASNCVKSKNQKIHGIICYFSSIAYYSINENELAIRHCEEASHVFNEFRNYERQAYSDMMTGNIYFNLRKFDKSLHKYEQAMQCFSSLENNILDVFKLKQNIAYIYIFKEEYNQAIVLLNELFEENPYDEILINYYCICLMKMKDYSQLAKWTKYAEKYICNDYILLQHIRLYKAILVRPYGKRTLNTAISVFENIKDKTSYNELIFFLDIIIDIGIQREDYRLVHVYQKEKEKYFDISKN